MLTTVDVETGEHKRDVYDDWLDGKVPDPTLPYPTLIYSTLPYPTPLPYNIRVVCQALLARLQTIRWSTNLFFKSQLTQTVLNTVDVETGEHKRDVYDDWLNGKV